MLRRERKTRRSSSQPTAATLRYSIIIIIRNSFIIASHTEHIHLTLVKSIQYLGCTF